MSSLTPPSNFPLVITTSSLQSALDVLLRHEFSALDLPIDPTDSMWERLDQCTKQNGHSGWIMIWVGIILCSIIAKSFFETQI